MHATGNTAFHIEEDSVSLRNPLPPRREKANKRVSMLTGKRLGAAWNRLTQPKLINWLADRPSCDVGRKPPMSATGQRQKSSMRVDVFCFAPKADIAQCGRHWSAHKDEFVEFNQRDLGRPVLFVKIFRFAFHPNHF